MDNRIQRLQKQQLAINEQKKKASRIKEAFFKKKETSTTSPTY